MAKILMQKLSHQTHFFDEFTLDVTRGCLLRGRDEIKLRPKSFEVLKYLVENNGRLISKNELINVVWVDTAVTDDSLVQCLKDIRHALHDETQQIIKTVHGRGYIFEKEVRNGALAPMTTYTEETAGVQVIIEEETNGHGVIESPHLPVAGSVALLPEYKVTSIQRLATTIKQHRWAATITVLTLTVAAAGIVYFTRPSEAIDSVAVMPLVNVNKDPNTDYLAQGISDNIIDRLSHLPNLKKVIALNSVLRYRGTQTDPQAVGRELNVRAVLMGQLVQRGDELSLSLELIDVRDSKHLWSGQYNRKATDMIALQAEIAQEIAENLRPRLSGDEKKQLSKRYTQSGEAYRLYMMGRYYFHRSGAKDDLLKSVDYFEQAIKKDPSYAPAYAGLGTTYHLLGWNGWMDPKESWQKEEWAALKALQIDDQLPEAHVLTAAIREFNLDWTGAEEEYKRALELDPNSVRAHQTYAWHLEMFGRFDEAMSHTKRAQELDPLSLELMWDIGVWFDFSRQYDRAIEQFQKMIEMDPKVIGARTMIAETYQKKGMYEEAIGELKNANVSGPPLGYAYAVAGKRDE
ncbi:MAG: tetratricopeptide repeat protein, partial [Pyrinomonadaceae bacterium]